MSCNVPSVSFPELSADPVSPSAGRLKLYAKADGLYTKDDAGVVTPLASGAAVDSISSLSPIAANQILYTNGVNQFNVSPITLLARQLLDDPDQATMLTTLGAQPLSADLTAFVTNASWTGANLTLAGGLTVSLSLNATGSISSNADITAAGDMFCTNITVTSNFVNGNGVTIDSNITVAGGNIDVQAGDITVSQDTKTSTITLDFAGNAPTLTSGSAVPASVEPDGSLYLRTGAPNGSLYVRQNGVWTLK